jgi:hypothetical protein
VTDLAVTETSVNRNQGFDFLQPSSSGRIILANESISILTIVKRIHQYKIMTHADFDQLAMLSDLSPEDYMRLKVTLLGKGQSMRLWKLLRSRCRIGMIRNLECPPGEIYTPVAWTSDYIIKYIIKNSWGLENPNQLHSSDKYIITITVWDLLVIDIDIDTDSDSDSDSDQLHAIKKRIDCYYPNDLFRIHRTPRGYHLYLVSRKVSHCSAVAIYMRLKLASDVAHGANSLYTGTSIRLTRKSHEPDKQIISEYIECYGNGAVCQEAMELYNTVCGWLDYFHYRNEDSDLIQQLGDVFVEQPHDFGWVHVVHSAPNRFIRVEDDDEDGKSRWIIKPNIGFDPKFQMPNINQLWSKFIKYHTIRTGELESLLVSVQRQMGYGNLYRIFQSNQDYAIGVHVQHNVHFIAYRDLLYIDYDCPRRLAIVARWARHHPEYKFRVVCTTKGYHVFLTSHAMQCTDISSSELLQTLCADPAHILGVCHRGYSVRINQKKIDEKPYREIYQYGKGVECPRLVKLYQMHLDLYHKCCQDKVSICQYQKMQSGNILKYKV